MILAPLRCIIILIPSSPTQKARFLSKTSIWGCLTGMCSNFYCIPFTIVFLAFDPVVLGRIRGSLTEEFRSKCAHLCMSMVSIPRNVPLLAEEKGKDNV